MILASATKKKNFVSIVGFVELLLLSLSIAARVDNACLKLDVCQIGMVSESCSNESTNYFCIVNFLRNQMVGMIFVHQIIHLATKIFGSTQVQSYSFGICHLV